MELTRMLRFRHRMTIVHAVRKRILEILKENRGATVAELAKALGMAAVSVRHHLDILQGDNLICVERVARKGNVGRPQQIYGLTSDAVGHFPNNFAALSESLVRQIKAVLPADRVQCAFQAIASEIASELQEKTLKSDDIEGRLELVTEFLSERGYLARWEVGEDGSEQSGYLLHKHNCPYAGVSAEHRELCMMDQALVTELVGQTCCRTSSMAEGERCCTYHISANQLEPNHRVPSQIELMPTIELELAEA